MSEPIQVLGREALVKNLSDLSGRVLDRLTAAVEISQSEVADEARLNHPYTTRTGQLEHSAQPGQIVITDTTVTGEVVEDKDYASYVELGTSRSRPFPHLFPALTSRAQAFKNRVAFVVKQYLGG